MNRSKNATKRVDFACALEHITNMINGANDMAIVVFDLDMTVIDSSHRHTSKPDGSIDLKAWFDNAKKEMIDKDTLLPLARSVRRLYDAGHTIVLCTARCMQEADYDFIRRHANDLPHHYFFSREGRFVPSSDPEFANSYHGFIGDGRGDGEIKLEQISGLVKQLGFNNFEDANVILFEDNLQTISLFQKHHAICYDATRANAKLRKAA